uniref:ABI family, member 3 (NESH) binding protein a n=1 Tax=Cyprinus carpio TaxID=7962 RepID=A0A8C1XQ51_CYPCA
MLHLFIDQSHCCLEEIIILIVSDSVGQRQNMRVSISAVGDTIVFKFFQPHVDTRLEGYILGYGSSMFSKQFIQLPEDGQPYETEIDAEPKYLIAVQSKNPEEPKKKCAGKVDLEKPLNIVIGSVTQSSVLLSWGTLMISPFMDTVLDDCFDEGYYTVRYREKEPSNTWNYQTCPSTSTVIDNLKPDALYEFAVRADTDTNSGVWSPAVIHNTAGAENPTTVPKQLPASTEALPSSHTSIILPTPKTTSTVQPRNPTSHPSTTQANLITEQHTSITPQQPTTSQLQPSRTQQKTSTTLPPPTTIQQYTIKTRFDTVDNSSVFSSHPLSEVDATGKKRFVAPHVIYRTDKRPEEPCSVTRSLSFFPDEEVGNLNVTGPPKSPPSNLTVVTVEGCPSFIILDWDKTDNETTEYEVVSSTKGPHGEKVSIQTTNQTHTTVQNLTPESNYEFKVTPKNELGSGPASEPVTFSTESADPRVSQIQTGKNAIWSSFPFKADSYSECNGQQFIKRTWYRKFVGIQLCNSLRYKIYLSDALNGKFYSIGDQTGYGEDHCQFVDSFLDGRTGGPLSPNQLPPRKGFYRAMRQEPVKFGEIGGNSMINYVAWYECGIPIPGKW